MPRGAAQARPQLGRAVLELGQIGMPWAGPQAILLSIFRTHPLICYLTFFSVYILTVAWCPGVGGGIHLDALLGRSS